MKFKQRVQTAIKAFNTPGNGQSLGAVIRNYGRAATFRPQEQLRGITYKAIDKIGLSLSDYELVVKKANGDPYTNHPLITLQRQPNPNQHSSDFTHLYGMLMKIYGETFWYKARGERSNQVKELYLLPPAQVELVLNDGELVGYILHKTNGSRIPFQPDEIYHDKYPNPFNEWRGMSVLERAAVYVDTEINTSTFTLNYIRNSASPSGIVSLPNMSPENFRKFTQQWREGYEGPENAGKTAFVRGEQANFQAVGATLKDIDQKVTRDMAKEDVLMMLDMPKGLLGMSDEKGMGRASVETVFYIYNSETIDPLMKRLDRIYSMLLKDMPITARNAVVTHVSPIPEDKEYKLQSFDKGVGRWYTPNEIREREGLEPIDGGDVLIKETQVAQPTEAPKSAKTVVLKKSLTKSQIAKATKSKQEQFRKELVETNDIYAEKVKSEISKFAGQQEALVIGNINATSKAFDEWLFNIKDETEKMAAAVVPIIIELMEAQGEDVANFITGELITVTPEVRKEVEQNILRVSGIYNQDTIAALETTLTEGQTAGESLVKLKKRVESVYEKSKGYRAERIARTESLHASNRTAELVYKQNGFNSVRWFTNPGACEFCETYSGRVKQIGSIYTPLGEVVDGSKGGQLRIEYSDIDTPPLHPNCTCSLVPED